MRRGIKLTIENCSKGVKIINCMPTISLNNNRKGFEGVFFFLIPLPPPPKRFLMGRGGGHLLVDKNLFGVEKSF
jgi:hypothetical protein